MILESARFSTFSRLLHWLMAVMVVAMLFLGIGMAASVSIRYRVLVSIHRPLGIAILILVVIRFVNRLVNPPPRLPATMSSLERLGARGSHALLYILMALLPLVGWGMLSAARYPIVVFGALQLPPILPYNLSLYSALRQLHTVLAFLLFATFIAHFGAALFHALVRRDGVFESMAPWLRRALTRTVPPPRN